MRVKRGGIKAIRRQQLILATLAVIDEVGLADASIALIAAKAGLSTGIVSHYFGDKAGLLAAVMQHIMSELHNSMSLGRKKLQATGDHSLSAKLKLIVDCNLGDSQTSCAVAKTWMAFWASGMHQPALGRLNRINGRRLYSNLFYHFSQQLSGPDAHQAAVGLASLIDGLWLRIALSDGQCDRENLRLIAYRYIEQFSLQ